MKKKCQLQGPCLKRSYSMMTIYLQGTISWHIATTAAYMRHKMYYFHGPREPVRHFIHRHSSQVGIVISSGTWLQKIQSIVFKVGYEFDAIEAMSQLLHSIFFFSADHV